MLKRHIEQQEKIQEIFHLEKSSLASSESWPRSYDGDFGQVTWMAH